MRKIPNALKIMLDVDVKIVNFTNSRPLNSRIFSVLCDEVGSSCTMFLLTQ
jgi:hypothetical protein